MQLFQKTHIDFLGRRFYAFAASGILLGVGLVSLAVKGGPRLGIDFTGGSLVQVAFEQPLKLGEVRAALGSAGFVQADLQSLADEHEVLIRVPRSEKDADTVARDVYEALLKAFPEAVSDAPAEAVVRAEYVGPSVGRHLRTQAAGAIFWALVLIIAYIGIRFRSFLWGFCGVIALFHDVISTIGIFSILNKEITITVVAGLLTLAGYSINDTIVVYDRMRENLRLSRKEDLRSLINRSINETLSRTVMTSMAVIVVLAVFFLFGGEVIHDFAFAMLWGVLVGTYSSIFVAAPIVYQFHKKR